MSKESNIDKILRGQTRGYERWYVKYVMENATSLLKNQKETQGFGKPGQRTNEQIEAEIEHLRAKDTETNNRVRSTYNLLK